MKRHMKIAMVIGVVGMLSFISSLLGGCASAPAEFSLDCGQRVTGAERSVELSSNDIVEMRHETPQVEVDGDGMTGFKDVYTFSGVAAGDVCATVYDSFPWSDAPGEKGQVDKRVYLHVADDLSVTRFEPDDFETVELVISGTTAQSQYYVATASDGMVRMNAYEALDGEEPPTEGKFADCYPQLAMLLFRCGAWGWNGYSGNNPNVLDGSSFTLTVTRPDGSRVEAHGTNAQPDGFHAFESAYVELFSKLASR